MVVAIAIAAAPLASALAGPAEDKATARELAKEGIAAEESGDCATAIDRLERAESLYHAPPHLQFLARCYAKTGRLVDATETWRKLTLETLPPGSPAAFKDAVAEANTELPKLEPRLARLTMKSSQKYEGFVAEVDGKAWPSAALDVPRVMDPGKHVVRARATGYKTSEQTIELDEGKSASVTITLEAGADPGPSPSASSSASAAPTSTPPPSTTLRTVGFVTTGVGIAALIGGAVTGLVASSKFKQLETDCPDRKNCRLPDLAQRTDSIKTLSTTTNVLLIGGGILAAVGVTLILISPAKAAQSPAVSLQVSPLPAGGYVALTGSF